jgi:hypothetical protein
MPGAGYNIPVSLSAASTDIAALTTSAGTTFNFASPFARGDIYETENNPSGAATATSAAAQRDASAVTSDSGLVQTTGNKTKGQPNMFVMAAIAIGAILTAIVLWKSL